VVLPSNYDSKRQISLKKRKEKRGAGYDGVTCPKKNKISLLAD
jgi:hypothetical protein